MDSKGEKVTIGLELVRSVGKQNKQYEKGHSTEKRKETSPQPGTGIYGERRKRPNRGIRCQKEIDGKGGRCPLTTDKKQRARETRKKLDLAGGGGGGVKPRVVERGPSKGKTTAEKGERKGDLTPWKRGELREWRGGEGMASIHKKKKGGAILSNQTDKDPDGGKHPIMSSGGVTPGRKTDTV